MNILLTGGTGKLGSAIRKSGLFPNLLSPSHSELDISDETTVKQYIAAHDIEGVIHTAGLVSIAKCEEDPIAAINANLVGTANLVRAVLSKNPQMRFVHISTDQLHGGTTGNNKETAPLLPFQECG